ncbi:MAG: hypothetical protein NXH70_02080 [Hyphomonas sp.]|nr:hypothetical protein [Hyphomonas sp.]
MTQKYNVVRRELESGAFIDVDETLNDYPDHFYGMTGGQVQLAAFRMMTGDTSKVVKVSTIQVEA